MEHQFGTEATISEVVVVGSGAVAEALTRAIDAAHALHLRGIISRNASRGRELALRTHTQWYELGHETPAAQLYIIATSDRAIADVAKQLSLPDYAILVHTSGSIGLDVLPPKGAAQGVFYPLQTFSIGRVVDFNTIPLFIESSEPQAEALLSQTAEALGCKATRCDSAQRRQLHLAAVFTCNFTNHLYAVGADVMRSAGLDFGLLRPLVEESLRKAFEGGDPLQTQTGPAVRGDVGVIERHLAMLDKHPVQQQIYSLISKSIWETSKKI